MIDHERKLIFVHIQKTGGNSVCAAFGQSSDLPEKHFPAWELRKLYGDDVWSRYFKFAFVRNPWERLVSWWTMIDSQRAAFEQGVPLNKFQSFVLRNANTFEEFLKNCDEDILDFDGPKSIFRNQLDYLTDISGRQIVDFIGRHEIFEIDFDYVATKIGLAAIIIPHVNASAHKYYADYYSSALVKKVAGRYARDIEAFGYVFGK